MEEKDRSEGEGERRGGEGECRDGRGRLLGSREVGKTN